MTDRELLELAAKAADISIDPIDAAHEPDHWVIWNPLVDDGDALRLAVKLQMEVACDEPGGHASFAYARVRGCCENYVFEPIVDDPCRATRRAIVLAAAENGRDMP